MRPISALFVQEGLEICEDGSLQCQKLFLPRCPRNKKNITCSKHNILTFATTARFPRTIPRNTSLRISGYNKTLQNYKNSLSGNYFQNNFDRGLVQAPTTQKYFIMHVCVPLSLLLTLPLQISEDFWPFLDFPAIAIFSAYSSEGMQTLRSLSRKKNQQCSLIKVSTGRVTQRTLPY